MTTRTLVGCSILVLDDDADALELYAMALTKLGANVRRAGRVDVAVAHLHVWRPQVVLCDLHLPTVDGYGFLEAARASSLLDNVAVIAISGSHPGVERERSLRAGFAQFVSKPAKLAEIVGAIDTALARLARLRAEATPLAVPVGAA